MGQLRILKFILTFKGDHQKIIRITFLFQKVTLAVRRIRNMLWTTIWGQKDFPMFLNHVVESQLFQMIPTHLKTQPPSPQIPHV